MRCTFSGVSTTAKIPAALANLDIFILFVNDRPDYIFECTICTESFK